MPSKHEMYTVVIRREFVFRYIAVMNGISSTVCKTFQPKSLTIPQTTTIHNMTYIDILQMWCNSVCQLFQNK